MGPLANTRAKPTGVAVFLVLGAGFLALFAGIEWFPAIWVFGFAVLVPLVALVTDDDDQEHNDERAPDDPVDQLKQQYAAGELTDNEFERQLERELADGDGTLASDREHELE